MRSNDILEPTGILFCIHLQAVAFHINFPDLFVEASKLLLIFLPAIDVSGQMLECKEIYITLLCIGILQYFPFMR